MKRKIYFFLPALLITSFFLARHTEAATMYLLPDARSLNIGQEFNIDLKIDTGASSTSVNSAQATIQFPTGVLSGVSIDKQNSIFGFWLEEPTISNDNGTIHFVGGTIKGVSGSALQVLRMKFKASGAGSAELKIVDAAVTATDGKGTNVLSEVKGTSVVVGTKVAPPPPLPVEVKPIERPKKVERVAVKATGLPAKPTLRVPLYSDQSRWYNRLGEIVVFWDLPPDVIQVSTKLSHSPDLKTGEKETELFTGKSFGTLKEGVWYIRVQFKNNVGWGETSYYKISLDTTPPMPFAIKIDDKASDNPTPEIRYETSDSFSGLEGYSIFIDGQGPTQTTSTIFKFPPQSPGKHLVSVHASDLAGNSTEDSLDFEVLPLPTPTLDFITQSVRQGEFVFASGRTIPNGSIEVLVVGEKGRQAFKGTVASDSAGHWDISIKEPLALGTYLLSATSRDERGAMSLVTKPLQFKVKPAAVLSVGIIELGWFEILIIVALLILSLVGFWGWRYTKQGQKRSAYETIADRDLEKLTTLLSGDLKELGELPRDEKSSVRADFLLNKIKETVGKMKKYLGAEIEKLK